MIALSNSSPSTTLKDEVAALGAALPDGGTYRGICPKCGGGTSKEASFAISRLKERVFYRCFRAKCHWGGTLIEGCYWSDKIDLPFPKNLRLFQRPYDDLDEPQIEWFRTQFGISPDNRTFWVPSMDVYAYKVVGPDEQHRGWQLRNYLPGALIKNDNYVHRDEPFISWYRPKEVLLGGVVVVEDIPSARKVAACGVASVALLGTSVDYERAYEIAEQCEGFVILALDRGMMQTMVGYRQRYEALWGSVEIWQLQEDLKYVARNRIKEAIFNGKSDFISLPDKDEL